MAAWYSTAKAVKITTRLLELTTGKGVSRGTRIGKPPNCQRTFMTSYAANSMHLSPKVAPFRRFLTCDFPICAFLRISITPIHSSGPVERSVPSYLVLRIRGTRV